MRDKMLRDTKESLKKAGSLPKIGGPVDDMSDLHDILEPLVHKLVLLVDSCGGSIRIDDKGINLSMNKPMSKSLYFMVKNLHNLIQRAFIFALMNGLGTDRFPQPMKGGEIIGPVPCLFEEIWDALERSDVTAVQKMEWLKEVLK